MFVKCDYLPSIPRVGGDMFFYLKMVLAIDQQCSSKALQDVINWHQHRVNVW